jgi:glycosyltransferase involved in cell wall biosynthesis
MIDYFNCSDCVILPYKSATQSGVIVDSYSFSRPCIAFNVGGIKEQIVDGQTGFLVSGGLDEFKNRIVQYINSSNVQKEEMCKNAYSFGKDNYSVQQLSIEMTQLFKRICEDKK